jgi:drug/metabolite transporter (DMT)-like permease
MNRHRTSILLAGLATLCWATVATAFKLTLRYIQSDVLNMVFYSSAVSTCIFLILLVVRKNPIKITRANLIRSILLGLMNPAVYYIVLFTAYDLLPGQQAQPLNYTWPIMLTFLSVLFLKQPIRIRDAAGIGLSFLGVILIATHGDFRMTSNIRPLGIGLALSSSLLWAAYWILNIRDSRSVLDKLFWNFLCGTTALFLILACTGRLATPSIQAWVGIVWVGLFEMGITFIFWMKALELSRNPVRITNIVYLSPFLSLFFLNRILGESISWASFVGLLLIVSGILYKSHGES